ncbi:MAG: ATP-binding protein [Clostridiales bacterium]|jgi:anti-sigma regulatory factor (Ser/Thr protein kinase)|nr:ATP-binding protein [Clostridiales bacterium]
MMRDMSMHIMDICQNSIKAQARHIKISVVEDAARDIFSFTITDDGCGMSPELLKKVRDPFTTSRTTRKVGLGIPMLEQTCQQCGGRLELESEVGKGTTLTAIMGFHSIDRPPMGDIGASLLAMIIPNENEGFELVYEHKRSGKTFLLDTAELKAALDGVPMSEPSVMQWISGFIKEGLDELYID